MPVSRADGSLSDRLRLVAQLELLDLAGRRLWQLAEHDVPWTFVMRKVCAAIIKQLLRGRVFVARPPLDERARRLAPFFVRSGHDRHEHHGWMHVQRIFELDR